MQAISVAAAVALVSAFAAAPAQAVDMLRGEALNPLNACQGALPSFEGSLRKRPRGMINEGAASAFLSCGFPAEISGSGRTDLIAVEFRNEGTTAQTFSCTAVDTVPNPRFSTKSLTIAAGTVNAISWLPVDNGGGNYVYPAVSCELPPQILVQYVVRRYFENVGM
jgi:hypothetical protein